MSNLKNSKTNLTKQDAKDQVEKGKEAAEKIANDPKKAEKLANDALKKAEQFGSKKGPLSEMWSQLTGMMRLILAWSTGKYKNVPWQTIVLAIVAVAYFVSPVDLIPDFIPVIGYIDDALVIGLVIAAIKGDINNFLEWESLQA